MTTRRSRVSLFLVEEHDIKLDSLLTSLQRDCVCFSACVFFSSSFMLCEMNVGDVEKLACGNNDKRNQSHVLSLILRNLKKLTYVTVDRS